MDPVDPSAAQAEQDTAFVRFWNDVLAPKLIRFKHILVDGLTHHSAAIFPSLPVKEGDRVLDAGCGFGDTAIKLAEPVEPDGEVVGLIASRPTNFLGLDVPRFQTSHLSSFILFCVAATRVLPSGHETSRRSFEGRPVL